MKTMLLVLTMAMGTAAGCAHGTAAGGGEGRDLRGTARVGQAARAIVVGPARLVHATGERPIRWFVAERVSGGDSDCAGGGAGRALLSESRDAHLTVEAGHVLCATVAAGATDVMWHQFIERDDDLWALR